MSLRGLVTSALTLVVTAMMVPCASAQEAEEQPKVVEVTVVTVKPGMGQKFQEAVKKVVSAHEKVESPIKWVGHSTYAGDLRKYAFISLHEKWAEIDNWLAAGNILAQALGKEEGQELWEELVSYTESMETSILRPQ